MASNTTSAAVAMVTGAAGTLGQAVAYTLATAGYRLVLIDQQPIPEWQHEADAVCIAHVDLTDPSHADEALQQAWDHFGRVDALVNVAGGFEYGTQQDTEPDLWQRMFDVNVLTAVNMCQAVLHQFVAQGQGAIVNVGAASAHAATAGMGAYVASKSAVLRLTEAIAAEHKHQGLRCNAVLPSMLDTPANRQAMPGGAFEHWVQPASVADVVAFLLSPAARDIHGVGLPVVGLV